MSLLNKTTTTQSNKIFKTYTLFGVPVLKKEKSPIKRKYTLFGLKFTHTRKNPLQIAANSTPPKKTPLRFPKGAKNTFYTAAAPLSENPKRIAVFASFSADCTIHDYVVYYLKELKKVADEIIFIADNPLLKDELAKLTPYVRYAAFARHEEYDFGSYKRGYAYAKKHHLLARAEELILCNDSCYGPLYGFKEIFQKMSAKKCDFWGMIANTDVRYHLQSYFLTFRKPILQSGALANFLSKVKKEKDFWDVVYNYELKLTEYLQNQGYKAGSYLPAVINKLEPPCVKAGHRNKTVYPLSLIRDYRFPLIKLKCFNNGFTYALQESPLATLEYIKTKSPALYKAITADLKAKKLLTPLKSADFTTLLKHAEVISFDIFDTLLIRPYITPTDMFTHMENQYQKTGFAKERVAAETRARLKAPNKEDITFNDIYAEILPKYQDMQPLELEFEQKILRPHPRNQELYKEALAAKKTIIAVSDMYLPSSFLKEVLHQNGYTDISKVYVSGEYNKTKSSGRLFKQVLKDCLIKPAKLLHIGDNKCADVQAPAALGIKTLYRQKYTENFFLHQGNHKYRNFYNACPSLAASIITSLIAARQLTPPKDSSYWQEIGYALGGPLALGYTQTIINEAAANHLDTLLFVSRDGYILQKIYNLICPAPVDNYYIYAPRILNMKCFGNHHPSPEYQTNYMKLLHQDIAGFPFTEEPKKQRQLLSKYAAKIRAYHEKHRRAYLKYIDSLHIGGTRIASVDMTTGAYSSERFLMQIFKNRYQFGIFSATFKDEPKLRYITYKKELINPAAEERIMMLMELLITAPEYPLADFINGKPIFKPQTPADTLRVEIMHEVEKGITAFVKDYIKRFANLPFNIPMSLNISLLNAYLENGAPIDTAALKDVSHATDAANEDYINLFAAIFHRAA